MGEAAQEALDHGPAPDRLQDVAAEPAQAPLHLRCGETGLAAAQAGQSRLR